MKNIDLERWVSRHASFRYCYPSPTDLRGWSASLSLPVSAFSFRVPPLTMLGYKCLPRNGCVHLSIHLSMSWPDLCRGSHTVSWPSPASLLSSSLLTTLHPNRHLASMSGHKLLSSLDPNYYLSLSLRWIWTTAIQSVSNDDAECLTEGIYTVILSQTYPVGDEMFLSEASWVLW